MPGSTDKKIAKLLFWCLSPLLAAVFGRLFFILFHFVYGTAARLLLGPAVDAPLFWLALATSLVFTIGAIGWLYRRFKIHILQE